MNRRDAKSAEADRFQPLDQMSLKGDWYAHPLVPSFLCALRVSAVHLGVLQLHASGLVVAGGAGAGGVGHNQMEEADAKAPACLSNTALHRLAGTDSPDEPIVLPSPLPAT